MKIRFFAIAAFGMLTLFACTKENTPDSINEQTQVSANDSLLSMGSFVNGDGHDASGSAKLYESATQHLIQIENLNTDNGPALRVYLSKTTAAKDFIDLGNLKAVTGNFGYAIDKRANILEYKHVLIWCERFSVLFGSAELK